MNCLGRSHGDKAALDGMCPAQSGYTIPMKRVSASTAKTLWDEILDDVQHAPVVVHGDDRDLAVVVSMAEYERLRTGAVRAFLDLRNELAAEAAARGLTEELTSTARSQHCRVM